MLFSSPAQVYRVDSHRFQFESRREQLMAPRMLDFPWRRHAQYLGSSAKGALGLSARRERTVALPSC